MQFDNIFMEFGQIGLGLQSFTSIPRDIWNTNTVYPTKLYLEA